jgi:uncharacterized membrane protein YfcA
MNAAAGGGSFITFPALVFFGLPPLNANASSTVALLPGTLVSAYVYRNDAEEFEGVPLRAMIAVSLVSGALGAWLLLHTPQRSFNAIIPWLMLIATLAFAFGRQLGTRLRSVVHIGPVVLLASQFVLGIYGGYFGAAVGIIMMAVWSFFGISNIRALNASKTLLVSATNTIAVIFFIVGHLVFWPQTCALLIGAMIGGYGGAHVARRIDADRLRLGVTIFNIVMTTVFFVRAYRA